jgi:multidrug efflux system outer membrane protein
MTVKLDWTMLRPEPLSDLLVRKIMQAIPATRCLSVWGMVLMAGCATVVPKPNEMSAVLPKAYEYRLSTAMQQEPEGPGDMAWWRGYGSEELNRLVDRGLANSVELRIATLQIVQAKVRAEQAQAGGFPVITAPFRATKQSGTSDSSQNSQASIQGAFRLDVWGEQKGLGDSADMQVWRAVYERENVQRKMIFDLVTAYIAYLTVGDSIVIARENEAIAQNILRSRESRLALGDATLDEVEQQRATLSLLQAMIPGLENQRENMRSNIARMVGAFPSDIRLSEKGVDELVIPPLEVGLPSSLLLRRPDIRMVEARMRAANANIDVARARLLPPIDLSAQAGYGATAFAQLLLPQNVLWNAAATIAVTVFDGGRRQGDKDYAEAFYEEMVQTYGLTVAQAFREVESALTTIRTTNLRLAAQRRATRSALNLFKIANDSYALGAVDSTSLLEARKNYQRNQDDTQRTKAELLSAYANLASALGSGADLKGEPMDPKVKSNEDGELIFFTTAEPLLRGSWDVALPGLVHRSAVLPVWRDLVARHASLMQSHGLRGVRKGRVDNLTDSPQSWYQLTLIGFVDQAAAQKACATLQAAHQACQALVARVTGNE